MHTCILRKNIVAFNILYVGMLILLMSGCHEKPLFPDPNSEFLEKWSQKTWLTTDSKERFKTAVALYNNKTVDSEPILLTAWLGRPNEGEPYLGLAIYDEQEDAVGCIIKETSTDPNGSVKIIDEDYPALIYYPFHFTANTYPIPIKYRIKEKLKDNKKWEDYLKSDIGTQIEKMEINNSSGDMTVDIEELVNKQIELWRTTLPAIYVSIPDPNVLTVEIQVYDKAGNKSNSVKLIDPDFNRGF